jgi:hypothetical protein
MAPPAKKKSKAPIIILIVILVIFIGGAILVVTAGPMLVVLLAHLVVSNRPVNTSFSSVSDAICNNNGYTILYQKPDAKDSAIIQCNKPKYKFGRPIYSVDASNVGKSGYSYTARATYIGDADEPQAAEYFSDYKFLFRQAGEDPDETTVILFVEAKTEDEAVDKVLDDLYDYLAEYNKGRYIFNQMDIAIFYYKDLSEIKEAKDYIALSPAIGSPKSFPYGNGFDDFSFYLEDPSTNIIWLSENADLYPAATTKAIKENRHAFYHIENKIMKDHELYFDKTILREWLIDSFGK